MLLTRDYIIKKLKEKLAELPVFYSRSNESGLAPQVKWLNKTFDSG
jgi:hypothetical protein